MVDWRSTGLPTQDAADDFSRARRRAQWARVAARLRGRPGELDVLLPFDEVVGTLGRHSVRRTGLRSVDLDAIVGSVDRSSGFDRRFRPTSDVARQRFERLAAAARRGEELPPIDVYQVGDIYFVRDGHHRVAVARALGWPSINALVTEVQTMLPAAADLTVADLPLKGQQRMFKERVPLPPEQHAQIALHDPEDYGLLAEGVEAWGFRVLQQRGELLDRSQVARLWWAEEYEPAVRLLHENDLVDDLTDAEAYLRFSAQRYRLLRSHSWDDRAVESVRAQPPNRQPPRMRQRRRP